MLREEVFSVLSGERDYQLRRWGFRQPDGSFTENAHTPSEFILYMEHYLDLARQAASTRPEHENPGLDELRKVVALGLACFEQNGMPSREVKEVTNARDGNAA